MKRHKKNEINCLIDELKGLFLLLYSEVTTPSMNHLGSSVLVADRNGNVVQNNHYYPFGLTMSISSSQGVQPYKYTGKELDMEHGLIQYDFGARPYDPADVRFLMPDPLAEKYYSISPYAYCNNNPVNAYDLHGDSIWYTKDDNIITMHVTGKVINRSSDNINVGRATNDILSGINNAFRGEVKYGGETYTVDTDIQLKFVSTMSDVVASDHLFVLSDADGKSARGATNMIGGKVMTIAASDYANDNWVSNTFSTNNTRTAVHEFGHAAGLNHVSGLSNIFNLMKQSGFGQSISPSQRASMIDSWSTINRGTNSYMGNPYPFVHDPKTGKMYRASDLLNLAKRLGR